MPRQGLEVLLRPVQGAFDRLLLLDVAELDHDRRTAAELYENRQRLGGKLPARLRAIPPENPARALVDGTLQPGPADRTTVLASLAAHVRRLERLDLVEAELEHLAGRGVGPQDVLARRVVDQHTQRRAGHQDPEVRRLQF